MTPPPFYTLKRNPFTAWAYRALWDLRHAGSNQRFVFVATTGRSGTEFLQRVFATVEGCVAVHEGWPIMHGAVLRAWNEGEEAGARNAYWVQKAVNVRRALGQADLYVETNHLFVKSFAPYAVEDFGPRLSIIHLRRDPVSVARSILQLGAVPGTPHGNDWYVDYRAPKNLIQLSDLLRDGGPLGQDFYRCLWYWYEIEARVERLRKRTESLQWLTLDWTDRILPGQLGALVRGLGKTPDRGALERLVDVRVNRQPSLKRLPAPPREAMDRMHDRFRQVLRERGLDSTGGDR